VTRRWDRPRDRNISRLEEIRKDLFRLRFEIPDALVQATPDNEYGRSVMKALAALQGSIEDLTSEEYAHATFYRHIRNLDNSTRGLWGEFAVRVFLHTHMLIPYDAIQHDRAVFHTPFGERRVDCYVENDRFALEVKSAYVDSRARNLVQVRKDAYLLGNGAFRKVTWILFGDGSHRLIKALADAGIETVLASDSRLQPVYNLFRMITLTDASEAEILATMDSLFEEGLAVLCSREEMSSKTSLSRVELTGLPDRQRISSRQG
jgi:hypothetical protein